MSTVEANINSNALEQLKKYSLVVADTGDFDAIKKYAPIDSTTNPSLILNAAEMPQYSHLIDKAVKYGKENNGLEDAVDMLLVLFGCEILRIVPGRVSTEVDSRLSFDTNATIEKAKKIIALYEREKISKKRILIKIAATWEGIQAAKYLEAECGIHCNLTLIFGLGQAVACGNAKVTLISPFVGRILDWHIKNTPTKNYSPSQDPGVVAVKNIYNYFKVLSFKTVVMGASFRNIDEILELSGLDCITISPKLLQELHDKQSSIGPRKLSAEIAVNVLSSKIETINVESKAKFENLLEQNPMAKELLHGGIEKFNQDIIKLENIISNKI